MSIPGQPSYMPYTSPYNSAQYDYLGGYRNYMPPNLYAQNQALNSQNQVLQNTQQFQPSNNIQFALIPSREVAQNATAEKGQTIYMMNQNNPEIYMKAADGFGLQTTRYFRLVEFNPEQEKQQSEQANQQNVDYIPRDEFNKFVAAVSTEINALKQQSNQNLPMQVVSTPEPVSQPVAAPPSNPPKKSTATKGAKS